MNIFQVQPQSNGSTVKITGIIRSFKLHPEVDETTTFEGHNVLDLIRQAVFTKNKKILDFLKQAGVLYGVTEKKNIIVTVGRAVLAERLAGGTTYTGEINYGALGTGGSPSPSNGDTTLDTEVFRKVSASSTFSDNIAYIDFFYTAADVNGTFTEFGNFIDGNASVDTGQLFSYIATGGWTKSAAESLFVSCQYTIS